MSLSKLSSLSKLPNEVLSCVLNNPAIPLVRRLHLRLLSNRWCDIIEDGLKKTSSLAIQDGYYESTDRKRKPDDLRIKSGLTDALIRILVRLFPEPTELTLALGCWGNPSESWNTVPSLFAHLRSPNLKTVKLNGVIKHKVVEPLARALATLSGLTCLTLNGYYLTVLLLPLLGPVLSRLEKLACPHSGRWLSTISASSISSSLSPRCTHLLLSHSVFTAFSGPFLAQLSTSLTHLHLLSCGILNWNSLSQMHRLTSLALDLNYSTLDSSLFSPLVPFVSHTHVKLYRLEYRTPLALPAEKEAPLPAVKRLTLEVDFGDSPVDYPAFFSAISAWFPNLLKLTILTQPDSMPDIQASSFGKLPFSVEIGIEESLDIRAPDW